MRFVKGAIFIDTNSRMKEISANLHRDIKDLLNESANIVTGFFKNGLCTVRGIATRWDNFTHEISDAVVSLFKSPQEAIVPELTPEQEPVVTVMESSDTDLPVGTKMTLSEAEDIIAEINLERWDGKEPEHTVKVAIDYMLDGKCDRYWLPLATGPGCGSMLTQMQDYVKSHLKYPDIATQPFYEAPDGLAELLHETFGPQLHDDLKKLADRVLNCFQQHYTISRLEQQFELQAVAIPEKNQEKFLQYTKAAVTDLRKAANTSRSSDPVQERTAHTHEEAQPRSRQSVRVKLQEIQKGTAKSPPRSKPRTTPER